MMGYIRLEKISNKGVLGGQTPLKRRPFNSYEPIAIKFFIEIICPMQILMGYMRLEKFHNN